MGLVCEEECRESHAGELVAATGVDDNEVLRFVINRLGDSRSDDEIGGDSVGPEDEAEPSGRVHPIP